MRTGGNVFWLRLASLAPQVPDPRQAPLGDTLVMAGKASTEATDALLVLLKRSAVWR